MPLEAEELDLSALLTEETVRTALAATEPSTDRTLRAAGAVPTLRAYDCGEFLQLQLHHEQDYIVQTLVPKGGAILLYAIPKSLKTWVTTKLALDVACGRPALGKYDVPAPAKVLLVQIEDREAELQKRLQLIIDSDGGEGPVPGMLQIIPRNPINLGDPRWRDQLEAIIQAQKPQLVILDVMRRFFRGDVNSAKDTAEFLEVLDGIRERHGCAIMLVHHSKKFRQGDMQSNALGSTNLSAWADVLIEIKNKKSKEGVTTAEMEIESKSDPPDEPTTIVLDPRATPMISVQGCASSELTRAKASFGDEEWTIKKLAELLKCRDARKHVKKWRDQNLVDELPAAAHGEHILRFKKADSSPTEPTPVENPPTSSAELQPLAQKILGS